MTEDLSYLDFTPSFRCEISTHGKDEFGHDEDGEYYTVMLTCPECGDARSRIVCETYGISMYVNTLLVGDMVMVYCPECAHIGSSIDYNLEVKKI